MTRRIVPVLEHLTWDPNAPNAQMVIDDQGSAVLLLRPHFNDANRRSVVIFWTGVVEASFGGPNDEGMYGHPLYQEGLAELTWAGEVVDIPEMVVTRHFLVPTKEALAEVQAHTIGEIRIDVALDIATALRTVRTEIENR